MYINARTQSFLQSRFTIDKNAISRLHNRQRYRYYYIFTCYFFYYFFVTPKQPYDEVISFERHTSNSSIFLSYSTVIFEIVVLMKYVHIP